MKKFLVTILAFVYLTVSSGATINMHYCMGKLMNWDLTNKQNTQSKCGICGMEQSGHKGCCKDEHKILQIDKDQKISESAFQSFNISSEAITATYAELPSVTIPPLLVENPFSHAPPRSGAIPIFMLNCNFRI